MHRISAIILLVIFLLPGCSGSNSNAPVDKPNSGTHNHFGVDYLWYGINQYYKEANLPTLAAYQADLQVNVVRFDIYWKDLEPVQDEYNWKKTDLAVAALPYNVEILFTVYSNATWAIPERINPITNEVIITVLPSTAPSDYNDYYIFIYDLVSRYKNRVKYYQIENEIFGSAINGANAFWLGTQGQYIELLQTAYGAIKAVDVSVKVLPSSIALGTADVKEPIPSEYQPAVDFISTVYSAGSDYFDIADIHLYYSLDSVSDRIQWLNQLMENYNINKPIWVTETGGLDSGAYVDYENVSEQAMEMVKRFVLAFSHGVEKIFWLCVHKEKDDEVPPWKDMKLTDDEFAESKKPAYYTYKLLINKIDGFTEVSQINGGYKFIVDNSPVLVLWNSETTYIDVGEHFSSSTAKVTQIITNRGVSIPTIEYVGADSVMISPCPIFVEK